MTSEEGLVDDKGVDEKIMKSLDLHPFLAYARRILSEPISDLDTDNSEDSIEKHNDISVHLGVPSQLGYGRKFACSESSDSSSSSNEEDDLVDIDIKVKKIVEQYYMKSKGLSAERRKLKQNDSEGQKVKKKRGRKPKCKVEPVKIPLSSSEEDTGLEEEEDMPFGGYYDEDDSCENSNSEMWYQSKKSRREDGPTKKKSKSMSIESLTNKRKKLWISLCKKEINKASKQLTNCHKELLTVRKKMAVSCMRYRRQKVMGNQKNQNNVIWQAKRLTREMQSYWKRYDRVEREIRKKAEKEALEQKRQDVEFMEAKRQQRKLNFLITQTELYAHFMSRKLGGSSADEEKRILSQLEEEKIQRLSDMDDYNSDTVKQEVLSNVTKAINSHEDKTTRFDDHMVELAKSDALKLNEANIPCDEENPQPSIFEGQLKAYQLKGMNWIANLYGQGINGILADEMGLGKTVQAIAFLTHIAERYGVWGPFLVVCPASTLHNWQQEIYRFAPAFKVVPYWGNTQERRILRQFWNQKNLYTKDASIHICVTSYQLVITDFKYFHRIKWQYMILDEAQAIKSTSSVRWKMLLGFQCRNRLLLSGTPIQNSMAELWALLHFIMPSLFDSHQEFNEWFSKDIESHAENKGNIDQKHLSRLHMILKPFMLRRIKKDVENELSEKIEIMIFCSLTSRQQLLYQALKKKIRIEDLLHSSSVGSSSAQSVTSNLMNLVMQFRKVCNHPELFERREAKSPYFIDLPSYVVPKRISEELYLDGNSSLQRLLYGTFCIFIACNIHESLKGDVKHGEKMASVKSLFSFLLFCDMSPKELSDVYFQNNFARLSQLIQLHARRCQVYWRRVFHRRDIPGRLSLYVDSPFDYEEVQFSRNLLDLMITRFDEPFMCYSTHVIHDSPLAQKEAEQNKFLGSEVNAEWDDSKTSENDISRDSPTPIESPRSPNPDEDISERNLSTFSRCFDEHFHIRRELRRSDYPKFLFECCPKVISPPIQSYCSSQRIQINSQQWRNSTTCPFVISSLFEESCADPLYPLAQRFLPNVLQPPSGWSKIILPRKQCLVTDAGKLRALDSLLRRLKEQGHRVLIYSQMTRMIDLLEEYMWFRKWTYMRLDGSSKISDRRDMVASFQNRSDIFVFLLSTRAGGLGINLTAADTVIFYDSDWNPTVDQQAMDRAHRLGQTKQVTVYRLICKGTIEERILQRAKEKSEIQRMVISGGNFKPDTLKPKEVVSLLLDDEEIERKYRQKQLERKQQELERERDRKRKLEVVDPLFELNKLKEENPDYNGQNSDVTMTDGNLTNFGYDNVNLLGISTKPKRGTGKRGRPKGSGKIRSLERGGKVSPSKPSTAGQGRGHIPGKRGPGRPRLKPAGPGNQGTRYYFPVNNAQDLQVPIGKSGLGPCSPLITGKTASDETRPFGSVM